MRLIEPAFLLTLLMAAAVSGDAWSAARVVTQCGSTLSRTIVTDSTSDIGTDLTEFRALPGARVAVTVPTGQQRCVIVRFTGSASCSGAANDLCLVELLDNGTRNLHPPREILLTNNNQTLETHSFEWAKRVGPGTHNLVLRIRVLQAPTQFLFEGWTMVVEVAN